MNDFSTEIFKAYDIRGKVGTELTTDLVQKVGRAMADWLPAEGSVVVGYDMRPDSEELAEAFIAGVRKQGRNVISIGQVTTDMMYFAVGHLELAGGAMITASHNPGAYNGVKLYRDGVVPIGLDTGLSEIRDKAAAEDFKAALQEGGLTYEDITDGWLEHTLKFIDTTTWPKYKIAIDAGNGMAGAILPSLLPKLPVEVIPMYFELDGTFPNHEANPMKPENLEDLIAKVRDENCDFGIAFDGDGDRAALVDDKGRPVFGTDFLTLLAGYYLHKYPGAEIAHDVRTSRSTIEFIKKWGGTPIRTKVGRIAIAQVLEERGAPFGGEATGHFYFKENYGVDSGLITALVAIQAIADSGKKLSELMDEYRTHEMIHETNFEVKDTQETLAKLAEAFKDGKQDRLDGLTVEWPDYWFNVRASNTEPVIRLNAEANTKSQLDELVARVKEVIQ